MAKFKLYQIHLTDAEIDLINEEGHDAVHKQSLKLDMSFSKNDTGTVAADAFNRGYYTHVSNITADNLEGVFHTGNNGWWLIPVNTNEYTFKETLLFQHKGNFKEGLITSNLINTLFQRNTNSRHLIDLILKLLFKKK